MSKYRAAYLLSIALWVVVSMVVIFATANDEVVPEEPTAKHEEWFEMAEENEGEDPLESEHIEQAIIENPEPRYPLTTDELNLVLGVVEAEARGESYEGKMAVAQTILNNCERSNSRPSDVAWMYASPADTWSEEVWLAVTAVFFEGQTAFDEEVYWFYNPALCTSDFHESQKFVDEIGGHRFFTTH